MRVNDLVSGDTMHAMPDDNQANNPILQGFRNVSYLKGTLTNTCLVSTGSGSPIFPESRRSKISKHTGIFGKYLNAIRYIRVAVTDTEIANKHAQGEAATYPDCQFFRFNTTYDREIALDEWKQSTDESITSGTLKYLETPEVHSAMHRCASRVLSHMMAEEKTV